MPVQLRQLRRARAPTASSSIWKGHAQQCGRLRAGGHREGRGVPSAECHPRRDRPGSRPRAKAVQEAADKPEHVHHGRERRRCARRSPGNAVDHRCSASASSTKAVERHRAMILDGPVDPELSWMTAWVVAAGWPGYVRTRSVISAKPRSGPPVDRSAVTTTCGSSRLSATSTSYWSEPVVQQGRLARRSPGEQVDDERERRRRAQRDGTAARSPASASTVPLGHEAGAAQPGCRASRYEHVARGIRKQNFVDPLRF